MKHLREGSVVVNSRCRANFRLVLRLLSISAVLSLGGAVSAQQQSGDPANSSALSELQAPNFGHEDMSSLSVEPGSILPAAPIVGETDKYPAFTRELIQLQWRQGDPIDLYIIKPRAGLKPPAVLYLYSYPSETERFRDNEYCQRVTAGGYAAIGFVSALTGQRYHDLPMREWFVSHLPQSLTFSVHDVQMVLNYLAARGDIDMTRIGMFGQGSGATVAILSGAVDSRIQAVNALQPWGDWPKWLATSSMVPEAERSDYLKPQFLSAVAPLDPQQWLGRMQSRNVRLQFVLDDPITPAPVVKSLSAAVHPPVEAIQYATKQEQYQSLAGGRAFDWLKQQLRPAGNVASNKTQAPSSGTQ